MAGAAGLMAVLAVIDPGPAEHGLGGTLARAVCPGLESERRDVSDGTGAYKYGVLGAGRQGTAAAFDLAVRGEAASIVLADLDGARAAAAAARVNRLAGTAIATGVALDAADSPAVLEFLRPLDAAIGAISYKLNLRFTEAAIDAGTDWCDLGGNTSVVLGQLALDDARQRRPASGSCPTAARRRAGKQPDGLCHVAP